MGKADGLSRRLDRKVGIDKDNENQIIIKDNWLCKLEEVIIEEIEVEIVEIVEKIKKARGKNEEVVKIVKEMKRAEVKTIHGEE